MERTYLDLFLRRFWLYFNKLQKNALKKTCSNTAFDNPKTGRFLLCNCCYQTKIHRFSLCSCKAFLSNLWIAVKRSSLNSLSSINMSSKQRKCRTTFFLASRFLRRFRLGSQWLVHFLVNFNFLNIQETVFKEILLW